MEVTLLVTDLERSTLAAVHMNSTQETRFVIDLLYDVRELLC